MSQAQLEGLVRAAMLAFAGFAIKYGIDAATWASVTGAIVAVVGAFWSLYSNSTARMVEQVSKSPDVTKVVMDTKALADAQPSGKVVSHDPETDIV